MRESTVIAMQGPFSEGMNEQLLSHVKARYLVTKDSGKIGGFQEKMEADMNGLLAKQKAESEALLKELEDNYNRHHEEYAEALFQKMIKG